MLLAGDGRFDSAEFSAFYCLYLFMCCLTNKILGFQLESKKPGKGSASMEPLAVKKVLEDMIQDGTRIGMFVSDRCSNIGKVTRAVEEKYMININLEFDV